MTSPPPAPPRRVFVSYTAQDLTAHADAAVRAIHRMRWAPVDHRLFAPTGEPTVAECRKEVERCDVLVVLVAHRYGFVPGKNDDGDGEKSITWLEVEHARARKLIVLPLLVEDDADWKLRHIEGLTDPIAGERLKRFKDQLRRTIAGFFTDPDSVERVVYQGLSEAEKKLAERDRGAPPPIAAPTDQLGRYLARLETDFRKVRLLGFGEQLQVELHVDELYVPLRAMLRRGFAHDAKAELGAAMLERAHLEARDGDVALEDAFHLARRCDPPLRGVAMLGDPGSGKTTCGRCLAWRCADRLAGPEALGLPAGTVPVFVRLRNVRKETLAHGLPAFLAQELRSPHEEDADGLARAIGTAPHVLWILDGLDEIADRDLRSKASAWIRDAIDKRRDDYFLVTCRFAGWEGDVVLGPAFLGIEVRPLTDEQRDTFVQRWYRTVERSLQGATPAAIQHADARAGKLLDVLRGKDFVSARMSAMVANPLLLSILCVVHRKDLELPRRRGELYDKCVDVLLVHWRRAKDRGTVDSKAVRSVLEPLAWWLHQEKGRVDAAATALAPIATQHLQTLTETAGLDRDGATFLRAVRDDAGILVSPLAGRFAFLHLTFQEHLAACHACRIRDAETLARHAGESWWEEVVLLALSQAPREMTAAWFEHVLARKDLESIADFVAIAATETMHLPLEPLFAAVESRTATATQARVVLGRILQGRCDADSRARVTRLAGHTNDAIVDEAHRFLSMAQPPVARASGPHPFEVRAFGPAEIPMVFIPGGTFRMGSPKGSKTAYEGEHPQHHVTVPSLWLTRTVVTNAQFARFLEQNPKARKPEHWTDKRYNQPEQPVVGVSWDEARAFCTWAGLRLPSEAEWEFACRAGTTTEYSFGNDPAGLDEHGWIFNNSGHKKLPLSTEWGHTKLERWGCSLKLVAQKKPNPWGLFDMHGNVWEWCEDAWHDTYKGAPDDGSAWVDEAVPERVLRGGCFLGTARDARSASGSGVLASGRWIETGFRPARSVTP